jgi:hypothetical protein
MECLEKRNLDEQNEVSSYFQGAAFLLRNTAQDWRSIKRPPEGLRSVSSLMAARIRDLCAFK